jgi:hypothetical protein
MYLAAARAEIAWLKREPGAVLEATQEALDLAVRAKAWWIVGELAYWRWRAGIVEEVPADAAEPYALSIRGDWRGAARSWTELGRPYEAALAFGDGDDEALLRGALDDLLQLEASAAAAIITRRLRGQRLCRACLPKFACGVLIEGFDRRLAWHNDAPEGYDAAAFR